MAIKQQIKITHKHVAVVSLALVIGVLFGIFIYPKLAIQADTPNAPTGLMGEINGETIEISWDIPEGDGPTIYLYKLYYDTTPEISVESSTFIGIPNNFKDRPVYVFEDLREGETYYFAITAGNESGEGEMSEVISVEFSAGEEIVMEGEPSVTETTTSTATITWTTNLAASSRVYFGPTETIKGMTSEQNVSPRVTNHETVLTGLVSCMTYWFKAESFDSLGNSVQSLGGEFKTRGCKGDSDIVAHDIKEVSSSAGATVAASNGGRAVTVVAPAAVLNGTTVAIEALKLEQEKVSLELSAPSGKAWAGDNIYSLKALQGEGEEVESDFDIPVEVSMNYTSEDVQDLDLTTLKIYHFTEGAGWEVLSNCSNDYDALSGIGTITCTTDHFSYFGLFGEEQSSSGGSSQSSGSKPAPVVAVTPATPAPAEDLPLVKNEKFTKDLWFGITGPEVKMLQVFLNHLGFTVATSGFGSAGSETEYFGSRTRDALIRFQETYKAEILTPLGLTKGTGFFGSYSRTKANSLQ